MPNLRGVLSFARSWANQSNVAYDQSYRNMQIRPSDNCICFDCSSFTFFSLWLGGNFDVGSLGYSTTLSDYTSIPNTANAWTVYWMEYFLPNLGWTRYNIGAITPRAGDIVAKTEEHCEIVNSSTPLALVGARNSSLPLEDQVAIHNVYDLSWYDSIWRYGDGPEPPTNPLPIWLLKRALDFRR